MILKKIHDTLFPTRLTRQEEKALRDLFNEMVFLEPYHGPMTVSDMTRQLIKDFSRVHFETRFKGYVDDNDTAELHSFMNSLNTAMFSQASMDRFKKKLQEDSFVEFSRWLSQVVFAERFDRYYHVGFTPKIACHEKKSFNCLGKALILGSLCFQHRDADVYLMIMPDHPDIATYDREHRSYRSLTSHMDKPGDILDGTFESIDNGFFYRAMPSEAFTTSHGFLIQFDVGMMHIILHNLEVLRATAMGQQTYFLPGSKNHMLEVAVRHKETLLKADWGHIQKRLFPKMTYWMDYYAREWNHDIKILRVDRPNLAAKKAFKNMLDAAFGSEELKNLGSERKVLLTGYFGLYFKEISEFSKNDLPLPSELPSSMHAFIACFRQEMIAADDELIHALCLDFIRRNIT